MKTSASSDFASLYPSIITKYNISAETLNCTCCPKEDSYKIDGLGLHICRRRDGIVAKSLEPILNKRFAYKDLKNSAKTKLDRQIYNERAASLKWILVCCLARESHVLIKRDGRIQYAKNRRVH